MSERLTVHRLKIYPEYFSEVKKRNKNFELRKDDRNFKVGDKVVLSEFDGNCYTGDGVTRTIKYVLRNCKEWGLEDGYCILGW